MKIKNIGISAVALAIGLGSGYLLASGQHPPPTTHVMSTTMDGMTAGLENKEGADFEGAFIDGMIVHHEGAVAMAQMVLEKSQRPELVKLANDIMAAQTEEINLMRTWKAEWFGTAAQHTQ